MFRHIFKYRLKILLYDKSTMFWTLLFPILLATLFSVVFGRGAAQETFKAIDTAVVDSGNDAAFISLVNSLSAGEERLFNLHLTTKEEALALLAAGKVQGIIETGKEMALTVNRSGLSQSILKTFVDNYMQTASAANRIAAQKPEAHAMLPALLAEDALFLEERPLSRAEPDFRVIYFFSLLAMTCLFGGYLGMTEVNAIQANLSGQAARMNFAPVHKLKIFLSGISAALVVQFTKLLLFFAYLAFVLSVDFGERTGLIVAALFLCALLGLSFGAFVTSLVKGGQGLKEGILTTTSIAGAFLSGMNYAEIKFIIETAAPPLALVNPVRWMTDAFYALYYFDTYSRFIESVAAMVIFTALFAGATYFVIRRRKYASL
jgi:ABC-2 type transport system permease protein